MYVKCEVAHRGPGVGGPRHVLSKHVRARGFGKGPVSPPCAALAAIRIVSVFGLSFLVASGLALVRAVIIDSAFPATR
eukprot:2758712-Lingulodinium_polyedra.AAC.1